ncbi:MAG: CoB--CoM heterodisulfide reductase iron-sulfur subunit A family protein [Planctomycetaceae bacterium]|jgi:heterodisulfide reductase subunit A|nr:CoB--CoM heterodisulfide reductase iron-sulfur subunit A family protein [Planctomycetaceae bacterium]
MKIGVFTCWCGENIARTVDCQKVSEEAAKIPGVHCSLTYKYMCSDPGQQLIRKQIQETGIDAVVVAACSPHMHLKTFRKACELAGLNPFLVEQANIREHCSWVHPDKEQATAKAIDIIRMAVEKVKHNHALKMIEVPVTKRAMVIGGGVAGIQAALDIASAGYEVVLVEKEPSIGGKMAGLSETFPTLDCSQCILTPRMVDAGQHPNIKLLTYSEVESVEGYVGNFKVRVRKKARYVDIAKCTGCGACWNACPQKKIPNTFDFGLGNRTAVYIPFPQAVPAKPVIDAEHCTKLKTGKCGICEKKCLCGAIKYDDRDEVVTEEVGAIVVSTGYQLYSISRNHAADEQATGHRNIQGYGEYGYGKYPDVIDALQFERLVSASGPTNGEPKRPSDGKIPEKVVFIKCVGSRDNAKGINYCSKICCMYTAKHTMLYKHKVHHGEAHVFYMDIRSGGKKYDEFVRRAIEQDGAVYHRGRVSKITEEDGKLIVRGADTLAGKPVTVEADMVVLAAAMCPTAGSEHLAQKLGVGYDEYGFLTESHPKLRPVETNSAGVFLCGACQAPKDIPEAVAQASAAAAKVLIMFSQPVLTRDPEIAKVDEQRCVACFACGKACPYHAIEKAEIRDRGGNLVKTTARVNPGLCMGCGVCVATCPSKSIDLEGFTEQQVYAQIECLG